jgi:hypothetical protein
VATSDVVIKKYGNHRLYDKARAQPSTLLQPVANCLYPGRVVGHWEVEFQVARYLSRTTGLPPYQKLKLLQLRVFSFRLLVDRDVGVGIFPEGEEVLVRRLRLGRVT